MESHADDADDADDADTERTAVKTYVPAYQKEVWREHADDLDMSLSEFVRTMVQAGRRGFGEDVGNETARISPRAASETTDGEPAAAAADGGTDLESLVVEALGDGEPHSWSDLVAAAVPEAFEDSLDDALGRLQADNRVQYRRRHDGYVLTDDER